MSGDLAVLIARRDLLRAELAAWAAVLRAAEARGDTAAVDAGIDEVARLIAELSAVMRRLDLALVATRRLN